MRRISPVGGGGGNVYVGGGGNSAPVACALTSLHLSSLRRCNVWRLLRLVPSINRIMVTAAGNVDIRDLEDPDAPGLATSLRRLETRKCHIASMDARAVLHMGVSTTANDVLADIIDAAAPLISRFPGGVALADWRVDAAAVRALDAAGALAGAGAWVVSDVVPGFAGGVFATT